VPEVSVQESPAPRTSARFLGLLVLFGLYPAALVTLPPGAVRYAALDAVAMALYVATWGPTRRSRRLALGATGLGAAVLAGLAVATTGGGAFADSRPLATVRTLVLLLFFAAITSAALAGVLTRGRVTLDTVLGAVCVYLLLGALWGVLYEALALHQPGAIRAAAGVEAGAGSGGPAGGLSLADLLYFSYAALTTSGFGDLVPATVAARTLTWTEAVTGQLYLAVLIARLVGLQIAHARRPP
jgi:hypothetical protein